MRSRPGFALLAALWLLVALSVVGLEFSLQARQHRLAAANLLETGRARAAAEAGLEHSRARLADRLRVAELRAGTVDPRHLADPWADVDQLLTRPVRLDEAGYSLALRDANSALNVNRATEQELRDLFTALRIDHGRADEIAQSIMDWRDGDDLPRARGAERDYYLRRGSPVLPRNAPFEELAELVHVRGVTPEILERVRPFLTVAGTGRVNLNAAPPEVLIALPGMTDEAIAVLLGLRRQGRRLGNLFELGNALSPGAAAILQAELPNLLSRATMETREVEVLSVGRAEDGVLSVSIHALLVRSGGSIYVVRKVES
jgi:general secretion pathway protein K